MKVLCCCFSSDGTWIASGSGDDTLKIWDKQELKCLKTLEGHTDPVRVDLNYHWYCKVRWCQFSSDKAKLISASLDVTLRMWSTFSVECERIFGGHTNRVTWDDNFILIVIQVNCCSFSPDQMFIASASEDKTLNIWNVNTGKCIQTLKDHHSEAVHLLIANFYSSDCWLFLLAWRNLCGPIGTSRSRSPGSCFKTSEGNQQGARPGRLQRCAGLNERRE